MFDLSQSRGNPLPVIGIYSCANDERAHSRGKDPAENRLKVYGGLNGPATNKG